MKGYAKTIEAILAVIALFAFLFIMIRPMSVTTDTVTDVEKNEILDSLEKLQNSGELRTSIIDRNITYLEEKLSENVFTENISVLVCNATSCTGNFPGEESEEIVYYISGNESVAENLELKLFIW